MKDVLTDYSSEITDDDLARLYVEQAEIPASDEPLPETERLWVPSLSPKQLDAFYDETENTLTVGNRFTGKGWGCGYNLVKHAYDYYRALVLVVLKSKRQGTTGGFFSKLGADILPDFRDNIDGFIFKGPFQTQEKDTIYTVQNRWGGVSIIQMLSIVHEVDVIRKIRGIEATKAYIDEITLFQSDAVITELRGTLKRNRFVPKKAQTLLASTNPNDPAHWVAGEFGLVIAPDGTLDVEATNMKSPRNRVISIMKEDNPDQEGIAAYYDSLKHTLRNKPTQYARDVEGRWVSVPEGDAMFADSFVKEIHVRGDNVTGEYLHPVAGSPIIIGMDVGDTNHGVTFLQEIPTKDKVIWLAFDEVVYVGKKVNLEQLTRDIMSKLEFWCETVDHSFSINAVSDRSAFDRFRATSGSYDHKEIERHWRENLSRYKRLMHPLKIIACPKPPGSVESRTRILMDLLGREELFVSAKCVNLIEALEKITPKKDNPFAPGEHSRYKHSFDSIGYPLFYYKAGAAPQTTKTEELKSQLTRIGS